MKKQTIDFLFISNISKYLRAVEKFTFFKSLFKVRLSQYIQIYKGNIGFLIKVNLDFTPQTQKLTSFKGNKAGTI